MRCLIACLALSSGSLDQFRTDKVSSSYDPAKATGKWYEVLFADPAQVAASCQVFMNEYNSSDATFEQQISVRYGKIPFSQTYIFERDPSGEKGVYTKYLQGAKALLQLPTVVVDVTESNGQYSLMTTYTKKDIVGKASVQELRLVARTPTLDNATLQGMVDVARKVGIDESMIEKLKPVNHTGCSSLGMVLV
mmetsp:Transcript_81166/g.216899  ORF Transcript_81166/g.216899 Transcript_81166/m.216899 type:complete len:193 (-) Transcript_81166:135-713(-)